MDAEVVIVGGGLAGSATAIHLARLGHRVIVLERATGVRDKVCGEGLMPHGVAALARLGVVPPGGRPFLGIGWTADGVTAVGRFPGGTPGLGMRRSRLDEVLLAAAAAEPGVTVRTGVTVRGIAVGADGVTARTSTDPVRGRLLIGADGLHSQVRRWAGLEREARGRRRYGIRGHLALADGVPDPDRVEVELCDDAELYVTPVGPGEVNVAVLCEDDAARGLKGDAPAGFRRFLDGSSWRERLRGEPDDVRVCGPLRREATDVVAERILLVGDAAGFVDGITGEGMSTSLGASEIAADVVSASLRDGSGLRPYAVRRAALTRDSNRLTELILWGIRHRWLARRVVRNLARHPSLFDQLLAIETGEATIRSVGVGGWWRLVSS